MQRKPPNRTLKPRESTPSHVVVAFCSMTTPLPISPLPPERADLKTPSSPSSPSSSSSAMNPPPPLLALLIVFWFAVAAGAIPRRVSNITVLGSVYCDACASSNFSKNSYFLRGAQVVVQCKFAVNSTSATSREEMSISAYRTTDRFGVYRLDVPPVEGFECREGKEVRSMCRATLLRSSSKHCDVAGFRSSTAHVAAKDRASGTCYYNLDALSYRPKRGSVVSRCGIRNGDQAAPGASSSASALIFWPILPPFTLPWPSFPLPFLLPPSIPFPFPHIPWPDPSSLPFPIPSWLLPFLRPPFFPFPWPPIPFLGPPPSPPPLIFH